MMKKILLTVLSFCLSASIMSACGQPAPANSGAAASGNTAAASAGGISTGTGSETAGVSSDPTAGGTGDISMTAPKDTGKEISITVTAPNGWVSTADDSTILHYENTQGNCFLDAVRPYIPSDAKTAMDVAKYQRQQIKDTFQEAQTSEPANITIDGIDAVRMELDIPISDDLSQKQVYIYFFVDDAAYQVMGVYFNNDAQGKSDVESMIQSMKIK